MLDDDRDGGVVSWFAVDDQLHANRKFRKLRGDKFAICGYWTFCGSWCAGALTDGFIPDYVLEDWDPEHVMSRRLVEVDLWVRAEHDGEQGYRFVNWTQHNTPAEEVKRKRDENRRRQAEWRDRHRGDDGRFTPPSGGGSRQDGDGDQQVIPGVTPLVTHAGTNGVRSPSRNALRDVSANALGDASVTPVVTPQVIPPHPIPSPRSTTTSATRSPRRTRDYSPEFEAWWAIYPRGEGKAPASVVFERLLKNRAVSLDELMDGARRYAASRRGEPEKFTKHAKTWLNAEGWADPSPRRGGPERRDPRTGRVVEFG